MAIVSNVLIGKTTQSVGNATFSKWKNKNVLKGKRGKQTGVTTDAQQVQRDFFSVFSSIAKMLNVIILLGFKRAASTMTERNMFMKVNNAVQRANWDSNAGFDFENMIYTSGSIPIPENVIVGFSSPNATDVEASLSAPPADAESNYYFCAADLNPTNGELRGFNKSSIGAWNALNVVVPTTPGTVGQSLIVCFILRKGTSEVSNSSVSLALRP